MTSFPSPLGGHDFQSLGFQETTWNTTLSTGSRENQQPRAREAVLSPDLQRVGSYEQRQLGKSLHSVTVTTAGASLPEPGWEHGVVQAITFLLQACPQGGYQAIPTTTGAQE